MAKRSWFSKWDKDLLGLYRLVEDGAAYDEVADRIRSLIKRYKHRPQSDKEPWPKCLRLFEPKYAKAAEHPNRYDYAPFHARAIFFGTPELDKEDRRDETERNLLCDVCVGMLHFYFGERHCTAKDRTRSQENEHRSELRRAMRKYFLRRKYEVDIQQDRGVSLFDVALHLEGGDDRAAHMRVQKLLDMKQLRARPIGKCPHDGRARLYRLREISDDVADIMGLSRTEKDKMKMELRAKLRDPRPT